MEKNNQNPELILLDKCTIQSLKPEELEIVSKHKILVPDIVLIENLKREETVNKLSKLENTYWIVHWGMLGKSDLLGQGITVSQADLTEITDDPVELKKQEKLAKKVAKEYDEWPKKLIARSLLDLSPKGSKHRVTDKVKNLVKTYHPHSEITDDEISRMVSDIWRKTKTF